MELGKRKELILSAIVESFIESGEPIGSKMLMQLLPISVSSATIRNEMAELERLGIQDGDMVRIYETEFEFYR